MISLEDELDIWWHSDRLTQEEWDEIYGENESTEESLWFLPQAGNCLISEEEKDRLKNTALTAVKQCREAVTLLGTAGYVSVTEDINMENYEEIEDFYAAYMEGRDAMVTIYEVNSKG